MILFFTPPQNYLKPSIKNSSKALQTPTRRGNRAHEGQSPESRQRANGACRAYRFREKQYPENT